MLPIAAHAACVGNDAQELVIRSRYGIVRDLIPIYSLYQLAINLAVLATVLWMIWSIERVPPLLILGLLLGWVWQYVYRPSEMMVTAEQANWLETILARQEYYARSDTDDRWRVADQPIWRRWPHQFIAIIPGPGAVKLIAPRDAMVSMRDAIELREENGDLLVALNDKGFDHEPPKSDELPWHRHVPAALLGAACGGVGIWQIYSGNMTGWGLSAQGLSQGRYETIFMHMFAHGSGMHFGMNMSALVAIGGTLATRLGPIPMNWLRFIVLFVLSGLAGAALYLALHPGGTVPMVGASGAVYGLLGLLIRTQAGDGTISSIRSTRIRRISWDLAKQNAFLFVLLALMAWASGTSGGLAWEAHLGGFLFGLFVGPKFLPRNPLADTPSREAIQVHSAE